mmetsp:Transcript_36939/g.44688  ORF Transcript_36939/g.44688 Transcript_36939/m.44688 type:complete len:254 (-) Transcript_36939:787-1548(-)|eukprot:CAMPEP_0197848704 /NCGR_PEP_ID=MMETSP1438-20131217/9707_1 /TAXON_ID=1461541 /ORGANISM="Pterosperma sp., Strain CCMP1384" /LENGTH=253 /DNA_ID=CAMNT_0043461079 /DNA_START=158 /DNA_END=919 /DNA_ORIENTATION=+
MDTGVSVSEQQSSDLVRNRKVFPLSGSKSSRSMKKDSAVVRRVNGSESSGVVSDSDRATSASECCPSGQDKCCDRLKVMGASPPVTRTAADGAVEDRVRDELARNFDCNVCFEVVTEPVVTLCGHLYCWPCLYRWMDQGCKQCPVCKGEIDNTNVIPIYGPGQGRRDKRKRVLGKVPTRPRAQRLSVPAIHRQGRGTYYFTSAFLGIQVRFLGGGFRGNATNNELLTPEEQQQTFLSRLLLLLGSFVIVCLLI